MKKTVNMSAAIIVLLAVAVVTMSFGFATMSQNLEIDGKTTVEAASWDVHFDYDNFSSSGVTLATEPTKGDDSFSFNATLSEPGDYYEATFDVVNEGSLKAELTTITITNGITTQSDYMKYHVWYNGTEYTKANNDDLKIALDAKTGTAPVKVRVEYDTDDETKLPSETQNDIAFSVDFDFVQAD